MTVHDDDQPLNAPVDAFNDAMDAAGYAISHGIAGKESSFRVRAA
jgi:hypothetical protein